MWKMEASTEQKQQSPTPAKTFLVHGSAETPFGCEMTEYGFQVSSGQILQLQRTEITFTLTSGCGVRTKCVLND